MKDESGIIEAPIGRSPRDRKKMAVSGTKARTAVTRYEVIAVYPGYTHLRCMLQTGRTHQIRVHMAYMGHTHYRGYRLRIKKTEFGLEGQCLHARSIKFVHPRTQEPIALTSELPEYFTSVLKELDDRLT
jgi:23S rRNA pseudouridine1911/1915/1917 synthase